MTPGEKKAYNKGFESGADSVEEGLPGWFGTFADMMTLLFAFFVLLAAISTMDPVKLQEMANSEGKSLGSEIEASGKAEESGEFEPIKNLAAMKKEMEEAIEEMKKEDPKWDYYHYDSRCIDRDSNYVKIRNKRLLSNEDIDTKCRHKSLFVPVYNTAPGFPADFLALSKDEILTGDKLISKLFRSSLQD